ncbi:hypothetical protein JHK82_031002 [Glycine max]|nr:hypothetical protein JHK82_031002 [Glycine max]
MAFNIRNSHTTNTAEQQHQNQQPPPQQQPSNHSLALQSCMNCHRRFPSIATKPKIVMLLWPSHESASSSLSELCRLVGKWPLNMKKQLREHAVRQKGA